MEQTISPCQAQLGAQTRRRRYSGLKLSLACLLVFGASGCAPALTINQIQFIGSHNSYKKAMAPAAMASLAQRNPAAAKALDYAHLALAEQLDLGMRKLELDIFFVPEEQAFSVGHVQEIDMLSHCAMLRECLRQIRTWSQAHPRHVPIWISFNAKDQPIEGLPQPHKFTQAAFALLDQVVESELTGQLIRPRDVQNRQWPALDDARGKFILVLDEQGQKRELYWRGWLNRPLFTNAPEGHPAAAIMIINDPIAQAEEIKRLVLAGYMVRTRADADTSEARSGDVRRREAALRSGAQAVSTDYYLPALRFGTGYQVKLDPPVRCNPVTAPSDCTVTE